jgi:hypothetical protein
VLFVKGENTVEKINEGEISNKNASNVAHGPLIR